MKSTSLPLQSCRAILTLGVLFAALGSASATLIMSDLFDTASGYTSGSNLYGQTSTASTYGFAESWKGAASNFFTIQTISMNRSGVPNTGGVVRVLGNAGISRSDYRGFTSLSGQSSLWYGSLLRVDSAAITASNGLDLMYGVTSGSLSSNSPISGNGAVWSDTSGKTLTGFQLGVSSGNTLMVRYQSDASGSGAILTANTGAVLSNTLDGQATNAYFLVAQLLTNTSGVTDTLKIWLLNTVPADESSLLSITPTFTLSADLVVDSGDLDTLLTTGYAETASGNLYFDSVHLGTTYGDLLTVPEPSTALLSVSAGLGLLLARLSRRTACLAR